MEIARPYNYDVLVSSVYDNVRDAIEYTRVADGNDSIYVVEEDDQGYPVFTAIDESGRHRRFKVTLQELV